MIEPLQLDTAVIGGGITGMELAATHLRRDKERGLTVRPELVEGWAVKPFMVRQAHHERLNLILSRLKSVAELAMSAEFTVCSLSFVNGHVRF